MLINNLDRIGIKPLRVQAARLIFQPLRLGKLAGENDSQTRTQENKSSELFLLSVFAPYFISKGVR